MNIMIVIFNLEDQQELLRMELPTNAFHCIQGDKVTVLGLSYYVYHTTYSRDDAGLVTKKLLLTLEVKHLARQCTPVCMDMYKKYFSVLDELQATLQKYAYTTSREHVRIREQIERLAYNGMLYREYLNTFNTPREGVPIDKTEITKVVWSGYRLLLTKCLDGDVTLNYDTTLYGWDMDYRFTVEHINTRASDREYHARNMPEKYKKDFTAMAEAAVTLKIPYVLADNQPA
jgi:hypothetical protein